MPASEAVREQKRGLGDLPADLSPCAREVSMITAIARADEKALPKVMEALNKLETVADWSGRYLVADKADYDWRTAPWRRYKSFADFYQQECADTWGAWAKLQGTYQDLTNGKINAAEAQDKIEADAEKERKAKAEKARKQKEQADRNKLGGINLHDNVMKVRDGQGNSATYRLRRLAREAPDILEAYERGEFPSVAAAARAAGIFKSETPLTVIRRAWKKASATEREQITLWVTEQAGWIKK